MHTEAKTTHKAKKQLSFGYYLIFAKEAIWKCRQTTEWLVLNIRQSITKGDYIQYNCLDLKVIDKEQGIISEMEILILLTKLVIIKKQYKNLSSLYPPLLLI